MQRRFSDLFWQRLKLSFYLTIGLCSIVGASVIFEEAVLTHNSIVALIGLAVVWVLMFAYLSNPYTREFIYRMFNIEGEQSEQ